MKSDLEYTLSVVFDNVTLKLHNVTLSSYKPCQLNNKGLQTVITEVNGGFIN